MWRLQSKALILSNYWSPWIFPTTSSSNLRGMVRSLQTFVGYSKSTWNPNIKVLEDDFPFQLGDFCIFVCLPLKIPMVGRRFVSFRECNEPEAFFVDFLGVGGPNEYRFKKSLIRFEESHRFSSHHPKNT